MVRPYPTEFPAEQIAAATALHRFGYGPRPGEIITVAQDPMAWLRVQIDPRLLPRPELLRLPSGADLAAEEISLRAENPTALLPRAYTASALSEMAQHLVPSLTSPTPFVERLVRFWNEYFLIPCASLADTRLALAFEREVIRPHMFGTLSRLLTVAVQHPAMLIRFNHLTSIGNFSVAGLTTAPNPLSTLPEHILTRLAPGSRETPTPQDIRGLTDMMTGWTVAFPGEQNAGQFLFRPDWHQPNTKRLLRRNYPEAGALEAEAAMDRLSRQEPTVRRIASRMARAVLGIDPADDIVDPMVRGFAKAGNSLAGMVRGLVENDIAWTPALGAVKTPIDLALSTARALDLGAEIAPLLLQAIRSMGQTPYITQTFDSWQTPPEAWIAPEPFLERLEWTGAMGQWGGRWAQSVPAADIALDLLNARLDPLAYRRLAVTANRSEGLALALATSGFQRR